MRNLFEANQLLKFKAATLSGRTDASFHAASHPCNGVTKQVQPRVACFDVEGSHGSHVIPESTVPSLFEKGGYGHDAIY